MYSHTLFLHGFTGSSASWRRVLAACPLHARLLSIDLPGHGQDRPVVPGFAANLVALRESLLEMGAANAQLRICGYSLGARLALGLLELAPSMISELVLIGVNPGLTDHTEQQQRKRADAELARSIRGHGLEAFVGHWERLPLFGSQAELGVDLRAEQHAIRMGHDAEGLARNLEEMGLGSMPSYWDTIAGCEQPISLVVGERDEKFLELARRVDRPLHVIPGVGHNVPLEAPEAIAKILFP